ncbi:MAG: cation:proton antiporter [Alphaproteobacteria bacterium]|nr:cation:proton antiporter [Alphaproteobacteria bacterium]MBU0799205.1 cation:proton antiporter [Alphaproteobacteria bacterium]MBU0887544.1 cation:proton antiporter [Alphaproteobacteria bacterium]MBU1814781.1 cation:proton antiporter [Alphaproteobacteria bacterium]MBU2089678.1 cation:proton antiporter [Alphaproteobacteria bacterium]
MTLISIAATISAALIMASLLAVIWRMLSGPTSADRVVAIDLLGLLGVCVASLTAILAGFVAYIYVAFGLAVFGFLGAVGFSMLLERASLDDEEGLE